MLRQIVNQLSGNQRVLWEKIGTHDAIALLRKAEETHGISDVKVTHYDPSYVTREVKSGVRMIDGERVIFDHSNASQRGITHEAYTCKDGTTKHFIDVGYCEWTIEYSTK